MGGFATANELDTAKRKILIKKLPEAQSNFFFIPFMFKSSSFNVVRLWLKKPVCALRRGLYIRCGGKREILVPLVAP
jgi:hypothetical protein